MRARSRDLAHAMGAKLAAVLGTELSGPPELLGAMAAVRLPGPASTRARDRATALDEDYDVVVSINPINGADWLRVSAAVYNEISDIDALIAALALHAA